MGKPRIITIDGPAGAGKSTVAKEIAKRFGYVHLDSGAVYRALGFFCKSKGIDLTNKEKVLKAIKDVNVELLPNGKVFVNGKDVTKEIRTPEGGILASQVAQYPEVRELVVELLR
jgi:cytidylate kinase